MLLVCRPRRRDWKPGTLRHPRTISPFTPNGDWGSRRRQAGHPPPGAAKLGISMRRAMLSLKCRLMETKTRDSLAPVAGGRKVRQERMAGARVRTPAWADEVWGSGEVVGRPHAIPCISPPPGNGPARGHDHVYALFGAAQGQQGRCEAETGDDGQPRSAAHGRPPTHPLLLLVREYPSVRSNTVQFSTGRKWTSVALRGASPGRLFPPKELDHRRLSPAILPGSHSTARARPQSHSSDPRSTCPSSPSRPPVAATAAGDKSASLPASGVSEALMIARTSRLSSPERHPTPSCPQADPLSLTPNTASSSPDIHTTTTVSAWLAHQHQHQPSFPSPSSGELLAPCRAPARLTSSLPRHTPSRMQGRMAEPVPAMVRVEP
ncbi:hypothetical protein ACCO45_000869 [Purpureocillium lilacinum]|uniref:Uncharacterized protein n=1 Tax=Purpureocillium lilacinum TaxID=33203 RepID=A0ACC4E5E6_PURLI